MPSAPENRVSTRLLHRTTRRLRLTEEGERFYLHAKRILSEVDDAENALYEGRQKPSGTLRVAVPVVFGRNYVMPVIQQYAAQWPDVDIDVSFRMITVIWFRKVLMWQCVSAVMMTAARCVKFWLLIVW